MPQQAPSKTELLELRAERALVREGKTVLEERRDLLAQLILANLSELAELNRVRERAFERARRWVRAAATRHGMQGLHRLAAPETGLPDPGWQVGNRLGIPWLSGASAGDGDVPAAGACASLEMAMAVSALRDLLANLVHVAQAESNLMRLTDAFRRTQRRVNALDHIILPELNTDVRALEDIMDEMERDELVRALLIKRTQSSA